MTLSEYTTPMVVAKQLAISVKLVYRLADQGELESIKVGRAVRILVASVQDYIQRHTRRPMPGKAAPVTTPKRHRPASSGFVFLPPKKT